MEIQTLEKLIDSFIEGHNIRIGNYFVEGSELVYKQLTERSLTFSQDSKVRAIQVNNLKSAIASKTAYLVDRWGRSLEDIENNKGDRLYVRFLGREVLATKVKHDNTVICLGNSSLLTLANEKFMAAGRRHRRSGVVSVETPIQRELSKRIPMIPFNVFSEAGLDITKLKILERGPNETVTRIEKEHKAVKDKSHTELVEHKIETHYTGATLFTLNDNTYLFDLDRRELKHGILNPFLVELLGMPTTIADAYESLKPQAVKESIAHNHKVLRQGEWFFIPVSKLKAKMFLNVKPESITLQAGQNRPNYCDGVQVFNGTLVTRESQRGLDRDQLIAMADKSQYFVTGTVRHSGREHKDLELKGWFHAVPNTATRSWTIRGDVD